jgi:PAS domain S-box-containing protein
MSENERASDNLKGQVEDLLASPELARAVDSEEFRQFLDHVPVAILVSRVRGKQARIVYCNATFEKMTGMNCAATVGAGWSALDNFVESEKPHRKLSEAIRESEDFLGLFRREAAEDEVSLIEAYAGVIQNADGSENYRIAALVDVSDRDRQQRERLRQEVRDRDMLLKELQHRVKNNLQLVIALIRIESRQVREGGEVDLERLARRVEALALLYRALTADHDAVGDIDLGHYLSEIASAVMRSHGTEGIRLEINVEPCPISVKYRDAGRIGDQ